MDTMMALRAISFPKTLARSPPNNTRLLRTGFVKPRATAVSNREKRQRRPQNAEGEFFVDRRCIDCDVCRWMAPESFTRIDGQSAVFNQPNSEEETTKALQALISCPTSSIHAEKPKYVFRQAQKTFPLPIDEKSIPGIYHCGYHSERAFGATSYLIVHPEGNILVDSPKYVERLARDIEKLGGARYMFLTHKDDIGDHEKWSRRLRCDRILHSQDVEVSTSNVENKLYGNGPWIICKDIELIPTPGHTEGSVCLFYKPLKVLFTGDHLAKTKENQLSIFERYNKQSVRIQLDSVRKILDLEILWILPGHGRRIHFKDIQQKNSMLQAFLASN